MSKIKIRVKMSVFAWHVFLNELESHAKYTDSESHKNARKELEKCLINSDFGSVRLPAYNWSLYLFAMAENARNSSGENNNRGILMGILRKALGKEEKKENESS